MVLLFFFPKRIFDWETPLEIKRMKDLVNQGGKQRFRAEIPVQFLGVCPVFFIWVCARFFSFGWVPGFFHLGGCPFFFIPKRIFVWGTPLEIKRLKDIVAEVGNGDFGPKSRCGTIRKPDRGQ